MRGPSHYSLYSHSIIFILVTFLVAGCMVSRQVGSPSNDSISGPLAGEVALMDTSAFTQIKPPPSGMETVRAPVFLESVEKINRPDTAFLVIRGNFPNGCTRLKQVSHSLEHNTVILQLKAWKPKNRMCTQVLTPFTYLYRGIDPDTLSNLRSYMHEGEKKSF